MFDFPAQELFKLQQSGTVSDYYLRFMELANHSSGLSAVALLQCFISGLNNDIRCDVIVQFHATILRVVFLAKLYEEKYAPPGSTRCCTPTKKYSQISFSSTSMTSGKQNASTTSLPPLLPTPSTPPIRHNTVKKMTPAEMQLHREKCLYYFCDKKFTFNHKCPNRQLLLLQIEEDDLDPDLLTSKESTTCVPNSNIVPASDPHLSLNTLKGGLGVGTIRFEAFINQLPSRVLVDGGSSNIFIKPHIAKFLKLPVEPVSTFRVMVGNGTYLAVEGMI